MTVLSAVNRPTVVTSVLNDSVGHNGLSYGADTTFHRTYFYSLCMMCMMQQSRKVCGFTFFGFTNLLKFVMERFDSFSIARSCL